METDDRYDCTCPGPPPEFNVPPPPPPPALRDFVVCSEMHTCDVLPVIDAELHSSPAIPSTAVIVVSSALLLAMVLIASALLWKYKRKRPVVVLLPCKPSTSGNQAAAPVSGVVFEDLRMLPTTATGVELQVKTPGYQNGGHGIEKPSVFICPDHYSQPQDLYNPVYQELSHGSPESTQDSRRAIAGSEDEYELGEPHYYTIRRFPSAAAQERSHRRRAAQPQPQPQHTVQTSRNGGGGGCSGGRRHQRRHRRSAADDTLAPDYYASVSALSYAHQQLPFSTFRPPPSRHNLTSHTSRRAPQRKKRVTVYDGDIRVA